MGKAIYGNVTAFCTDQAFAPDNAGINELPWLGRKGGR